MCIYRCLIVLTLCLARDHNQSSRLYPAPDHASLRKLASRPPTSKAKSKQIPKSRSDHPQKHVNNEYESRSRASITRDSSSDHGANSLHSRHQPSVHRDSGSEFRSQVELNPMLNAPSTGLPLKGRSIDWVEFYRTAVGWPFTGKPKRPIPGPVVDYNKVKLNRVLEDIDRVRLPAKDGEASPKTPVDIPVSTNTHKEEPVVLPAKDGEASPKTPVDDNITFNFDQYPSLAHESEKYIKHYYTLLPDSWKERLLSGAVDGRINAAHVIDDSLNYILGPFWKNLSFMEDTKYEVSREGTLQKKKDMGNLLGNALDMSDLMKLRTSMLDTRDRYLVDAKLDAIERWKLHHIDRKEIEVVLDDNLSENLRANMGFVADMNASAIYKIQTQIEEFCREIGNVNIDNILRSQVKNADSISLWDVPLRPENRHVKPRSNIPVTLITSEGGHPLPEESLKLLVETLIKRLIEKTELDEKTLLDLFGAREVEADAFGESMSLLRDEVMEMRYKISKTTYGRKPEMIVQKKHDIGVLLDKALLFAVINETFLDVTAQHYNHYNHYNKSNDLMKHIPIQKTHKLAKKKVDVVLNADLVDHLINNTGMITNLDHSDVKKIEVQINQYIDTMRKLGHL
eukprot:GHVH01016032.1.p1 GENE.GHVH01016032.1~~GHVH01016032.1.p1  ORF type:complete len:626 (+),score=77.33 GHVH01016032.1:193-2070(+)